MANNHEGTAIPNPEFDGPVSRAEQLAKEFYNYLEPMTEVGGAQAFYNEALIRESGVTAEDDEGYVAVGIPGSPQSEPDPFAFWAESFDTAAGNGTEGPVDGARGTAEAARIQTDPMGTLRDLSRAHVEETAETAGEAGAVNTIGLRSEAEAIILLTVPYQRGIEASRTLTDVSRFAYEQGDPDSVRAVQFMLQKMKDNGSQSVEFIEKSRARATAYYHGLSLGDLESEQHLSQLLEAEKKLAELKGGLEQETATRGAALIRTAEECVRRDIPTGAYVDRYVESKEGRWAVNFEALRNVVGEDRNEAAALRLQEHLGALASQKGLDDIFLRATISRVLQHADDPALKARLLDRYHMVASYRSNQSFENYQQLTTLAEALLADKAYMQTRPGDLYYLNEQIQDVARTQLHEGSGTLAFQRDVIERTSGELSVATMIWGNSSSEAVSGEIEARKASVATALENDRKKNHSTDTEGRLSEGIREGIARKAESHADAMRVVAARQLFRKEEFDACGTMVSSITDPNTQYDAYLEFWTKANTGQITHMTPLEVAVAEDPTSPLVELHETALTLASWNPAAISARFENLSGVVSIAAEANQLLNNRTQSQHAQTQLLLERLTQLDPAAAQALAREHLPKLQAGYIDFKRHYALEPYYRAITTPGQSEAYSEVLGYISGSSELGNTQKMRELARYALHLQRVSKILRTYELPD